MTSSIQSGNPNYLTSQLTKVYGFQYLNNNPTQYAIVTGNQFGATQTISGMINTMTISTTQNSFAAAVANNFYSKIRVNNITDNQFLCSFPTVDDFTYFCQVGCNTGQNSVFFGYYFVGEFCLGYQFNGLCDVHKLTITTAATGSENATLTLNGIPFTIALTNAAADKNFTAFQIFNSLGYASLYGSQTNQSDFSVTFISLFSGPLAGSFSFSSATAVGSFSQLQVGVVATSSKIVGKSNWNGKSAIANILNVANMNQYSIQFQLGEYINWRIFNPFIENWEVVHSERLGNTNNVLCTSDLNPSVLLFRVAPSGSSTSVKFAGMSSYQLNPQLPINLAQQRFTFSNSRSSGMTVNTEVVLFSLFNTPIQNNNVNALQIFLSSLSVITNSGANNPVQFRIYTSLPATTSLGVTTSTYPQWTSIGNGSICQSDVHSTTITNGNLIYSFIINQQTSEFVDLSSININIIFQSFITVTVTSLSGSLTYAAASMIWFEN